MLFDIQVLDLSRCEGMKPVSEKVCGRRPGSVSLDGRCAGCCVGCVCLVALCLSLAVWAGRVAYVAQVDVATFLGASPRGRVTTGTTNAAAGPQHGHNTAPAEPGEQRGISCSPTTLRRCHPVRVTRQLPPLEMRQRRGRGVPQQECRPHSGPEHTVRALMPRFAHSCHYSRTHAKIRALMPRFHLTKH